MEKYNILITEDHALTLFALKTALGAAEYTDRIFEAKSAKEAYFATHFPDTTKQICFPDGTQRFIQIDGKEETYYPNGIIQKQNTKKDVSHKAED